MSIDPTQIKQGLAEQIRLFSECFPNTKNVEMLNLLRSALAVIEQQEQEEVRRIKHLNRLATWAQQDPTGPVCAGGIQQWVLAELKAALGAKYEPSGFKPESHQNEELRQRIEQLEAACAAMREALEHYRPYHQGSPRIDKALSTDAGKAMLERLHTAEHRAQLEKEHHEFYRQKVSDYMGNEVKLIDRLQAVEKALEFYADEENYANTTDRGNVTAFGKIWLDNGAIARNLLHPAPQPKDSQ